MDKFDYQTSVRCCPRCGIRAVHRDPKSCVHELAGHAGNVTARIVASGSAAAIDGLRNAIAELEFALALQKPSGRRAVRDREDHA